MKILFFANNWTGWQVLSWLKSQKEDVAGVVLHPTERQRFGDEIRAAAGLPADRLFNATSLREPATLDAIRALSPDIGVSVCFGYILREELLSIFPQGAINLHSALLPYNRGANPNVWSIVDGTPAGVTLHYVDKGVDTGAVIARREVPVEPVDTGETLYKKLEQESLRLFQETWPSIKAGRAPRQTQKPGEGTSHKLEDLKSIDEIHLDKSYPAGKLLDILRARTFPPYPGAWFVRNGRKVRVRVELEYDDEKA